MLRSDGTNTDIVISFLDVSAAAARVLQASGVENANARITVAFQHSVSRWRRSRREYDGRERRIWRDHSCLLQAALADHAHDHHDR